MIYLLLHKPWWCGPSRNAPSSLQIPDIDIPSTIQGKKNIARQMYLIHYSQISFVILKWG